MSIRGKVAASAAAVGVLIGGGLAAAPAAQAGTSIRSTYNAASHIYYSFSASNNKFCIRSSTSRGTANVDFYRNGKYMGGIAASRAGRCDILTKRGFKEGDHATFKLRMYKKGANGQLYRTSNGKVFI